MPSLKIDLHSLGLQCFSNHYMYKSVGFRNMGIRNWSATKGMLPCPKGVQDAYHDRLGKVTTVYNLALRQQLYLKGLGANGSTCFFNEYYIISYLLSYIYCAQILQVIPSIMIMNKQDIGGKFHHRLDLHDGSIVHKNICDAHSRVLPRITIMTCFVPTFAMTRSQ